MKYTTIPTHICTEPKCNTPMTFYWQPTWGKSAAPDTLNGEPGAMMATCFNKRCEMYGVTRWIEDHINMPEEKREEYRQTRRASLAAQEVLS